MNNKPLSQKKIESIPKIYSYRILNSPSHKGHLKVGYTTRSVVERVHEQLSAANISYKIVVEESAMRNDGSTFSDHDVHKQLKKQNIVNTKNEWFKCSEQDVKAAILAIKNRENVNFNRDLDFKMRPEQAEAVRITASHFNDYKKETRTPHFLWNAKMRFGKTFTAYQLALKMNWSKILILTFKPAVQNAWEEDLTRHLDFQDWQFISSTGLQYENLDESKPFACFGSFQNFLGKTTSGAIKPKNEWVHLTDWDCVIFDEYHYGAWRETAKDLFSSDGKENEMILGSVSEFHEETLLINTSHYLYLSGTPFKAIQSGEFIEEEIFNWTYTDEQLAKKNWSDNDGINPYLSLPRMVLLTYKMPDDIRQIAENTEFNEFDLNVFFEAKGEGDQAEFIHKFEVQKWLNLIRGSHQATNTDNLNLGSKKPPMPFSDLRLMPVLLHTLWFLPTVASCFAMKNLLNERHNIFYQDYRIIVAAGTSAGIGINALPPVFKAMGDPLKNKTITLSCGKLTTGVTIRPWTGILMLRNCSSPETYFQSAFRVQSPWVIKNPNKNNPHEVEIIKEECYVFDFAPNRALSQVADYSCRLNVSELNVEKKVQDFINFLPVLAYDGSKMIQIDAKGVLDMAMSGTTATLLARRWESALLVNVDNETLARLMDNQQALDALMNIEGFRSLNVDIENIINKTNEINKTKKEKEDITPREKRELTEEEKKYKKLRKQIQEKLVKFATRVPIFMYLTDFRERSLTDIITQLEPGLFKKVTSLSIEDFQLLMSVGVFNNTLMNSAVYQFKRYEDASLEYTGINKHEGEDVGLFDTTVTEVEYLEEL
jgi:hypothetical protein